MSDENKPKSKLDVAFEEFESLAQENNVIRRELIEQLRKDVKAVGKVSEYDKAMMVSAKMSMYTTLTGIMKDVENTAMQKVKLKMQRSEQESGGSLAAAVTHLLKMVRADDVHHSEAPVKSDTEIADELNKQAEERGISVSEGELLSCTAALPELPDKFTESEEKEDEDK
jgi:hypothetical protein